MKNKKAGEFELIKKLTKKINNNSEQIITGIGDDCAVIKKNDKHYLLYTCDALVEDIHFSAKFFTPQQIGRKAVAVNASDIAAMGGQPQFCLVSLIIPETLEEHYIEKIYDGMRSACREYEIQIVGGNISKGKQLVIDIFMSGQINADKLITRSGARPGDKILVTGFLGDACAGFEILNNKKFKMTKSAVKKLITAQLTPKPRFEESQVLADLRIVTSMIDISDGLSSDLSHICGQSKLGAEIYEELLPISPELHKLANENNLNILDFALNGGEDYELLFTAPKQEVDKIIRSVKSATGIQVSVIGEILQENKGRWVRPKNGNKKKLEPGGWDHLKTGSKEYAFSRE